MRLLCHSYANNQAFGIAGALTHENSKFGQVIGGSEKDINALWQKIQKYNQYKNVRLIEPRSISERSFSK